MKRLKMNVAAPKKPSVLIQMALTDLRQIERLKSYEVRMSNYHTPLDDVCYVCFAGCMIARRSTVPASEHASPGQFASDWFNRLRGLDEIRKSHVAEGCMRMDVNHSAVRKIEAEMYGSYVSYGLSPKSFKRWVVTLITELRKVGL